MVGIFALGHVSGAHFNPAVTLGVWIRGKIDPVGAGFYVLTQLVAAFLAAVAVPFTSGHTDQVSEAGCTEAALEGFGAASKLPAQPSAKNAEMQQTASFARMYAFYIRQ